MINATILASRLKHAIKVLRRVNDEVILNIENGKITSRVVDPANAAIVWVDISTPAAVIEPHTVGIDLEYAAGFILRASAKDDIVIKADDLETWQMTRGIHQRTVRLLDPERVRKCPPMPKLPYTATIRMSGKTFKEIIAEAAGVDDHIVVRATAEAMTIEAVSKNTNGDRYKATLLEPVFKSDATGIYALEYLQDIATDMIAKDDVMFTFSTDNPCEIEYERDGVKIAFMLAPRIESD